MPISIGFPTSEELERFAWWALLMQEIRVFTSFIDLKIGKKRRQAQERLAETRIGKHRSQAQERLSETRKRQEIQRAQDNEKKRKWDDLQDLAGPACNWPHSIEQLMWKLGFLSYNERFRVVLFFFNNGCNPEIILEWFQFRNMIDSKSYLELRTLIKDLEAPTEITKQYYSWDLHCGIDLTIEGLIPSKKRMPNHRTPIEVDDYIKYLGNRHH